MSYFVYMLRCEDNSIYTGITTDVKRRVREHFYRDKNCAKYTFVHHVKSIEMVWQADNRISASQLEYYLKRLKKSQKEDLILHPEKLVSECECIPDSCNFIPLTIKIENCLE